MKKETKDLDISVDEFLQEETFVSDVKKEQINQEALKKEIENWKKRFPKGVDYIVAYDPTRFIEVTLEEMQITIPEATAEFLTLFDPEMSVAKREITGGTGFNAVQSQLDYWISVLK